MCNSGRPRNIRVAIIDTRDVYRTGLRCLIAGHPDFELAAEYGSMAQAADNLPMAADVAIINSRLALGDHFDTLRAAILNGTAPHLLLLVPAHSVPLGDASRACWCLKESSGADVIRETICLAAQGGGPAVMAAPAADPLSSLTEEERMVLALLADGLTNRAIANRLYLSESSIKKHVHRILQTLGCARRAQAAAFYTRHQPPSDSPHGCRMPWRQEGTAGSD